MKFFYDLVLVYVFVLFFKVEVKDLDDDFLRRNDIFFIIVEYECFLNVCVL